MTETIDEEVWVDIKDYKGMYQVSNKGRVRSLDRRTRGRNRYGDHLKFLWGKVLKPKTNTLPTTYVLSKDCYYKFFRLKDLLNEHFPEGRCIK